MTGLNSVRSNSSGKTPARGTAGHGGGGSGYIQCPALYC